MTTAAVITVSDRSFEGKREDLGGPAVAKRLEKAGFKIEYREIIPDEREAVIKAIRKYSEKVDFVVTTGGTGTAKRDVTPEATRAAIERELPGFGEAMRAASLKITPHATLSCATAGLLGKALVLNLPGSPKGAVENLDAVLGAVEHGIEIWQGRGGD